MNILTRRQNKKEQGFTIVELLIVIVVIAILAAITIVAYNGITANANNSARLSDVNTLTKAIEMRYAKDNLYGFGSEAPSSRADYLGVYEVRALTGRLIVCNYESDECLVDNPESWDWDKSKIYLASSNDAVAYSYWSVKDNGWKNHSFEEGRTNAYVSEYPFYQTSSAEI